MDSVTVCNLALNMLGINNIVSFDEKNPNAQICRQFYPVIRDRVLRDHAWSFAARAFELSEVRDIKSIDPQKPVVSAVPGDCLAMRYILEDLPFRAWGRYIMTPALPATLVYTARIEDASLFDETFTAALQYALAVELAMCFSRDANLIAMFRNEYQAQIALARSIDSAENYHAYQREKRSNWIASRYENNVSGVSQMCGQQVKFVPGTAGKQA
jgi:hypothetical protein